MSGEVTQLLVAIGQGDEAAFQQLFRMVYDELHRRARAQLAGSAPATLGPTALVHEAYLKLLATNASQWKDRGHFYRVAARAMRQIAIDGARARRAQKRGDGAVHLDLDAVPAIDMDAGESLIALDAALTELGRRDEQMSQVVELRFFAGLSVADTAAAMALSERTIKRQWRLARAFLYSQLGSAEAPGN